MKTTQIQLNEAPSLGGNSHIEKPLRAIPGVQDVKVETDARRVTVQHEDIDEAQLLNGVRATGLPADLIPQDAAVLAPSVPKRDSGS